MTRKVLRHPVTMIAIAASTGSHVASDVPCGVLGLCWFGCLMAVEPLITMAREIAVTTILCSAP